MPKNYYLNYSPQKRRSVIDKVRLRKTGHTPEYFQSKIREQDGKCGTCDRDFDLKAKPQADHDHATRTPRGVLCGRCNTLLGWVEKHPDLLRKIEAYLAAYIEV